MSLHIYFDGVDKLPDLPVKRDAVRAFRQFELTGCEYDRVVLSDIECGEYRDDTFFTDRFGSKVRLDDMSTGSKVALALYHITDAVINGEELGSNALTEIVMHCRFCHLLLPASSHYVAGKLEDMEIDVVCKGKSYTSLNEFAEYMMEDAPDA